MHVALVVQEHRSLTARRYAPALQVMGPVQLVAGSTQSGTQAQVGAEPNITTAATAAMKHAPEVFMWIG